MAPDAPRWANPLYLLRLVRRYTLPLMLMYAAIAAAAIGLLVVVPRTYLSEGKMILNVGRETVGLDATATAGGTINFQQSGRRDEMVSAMELLTSRVIYENIVDRVGEDVVLGDQPPPRASTGAGDGVGEAAVDDVGDDAGDGGGVKGSPLWNSTAGAALAWIKGLDPISRREEAVVTVSKSMIANVERDSFLIELRYESESPQLSRHVVETAMEIFRERHRDAHFNPDSQSFFQTQTAAAQTALDQAAEALRTMKDEMQLSSIAGARELLDRRQLQVESDLFETERSLEELKARGEVITRQLSTSPERLTSATTSLPNTGRDAIESQLYTLKMELMEARVRYLADHPKLKVLQDQVSEAEARLAAVETSRQQETTDVNPIYQERLNELALVKSQMAGKVASLVKLEQEADRLAGQIRQLNENEKRINDAERRLAIAETNYRSYADKLENATIDAALQAERISSVNVVQHASLQEKPVSPNKLLILAMSMAFAGFASIGLVALGEGVSATRRAIVAERRNAALERAESSADDEFVDDREEADAAMDSIGPGDDDPPPAALKKIKSHAPKSRKVKPPKVKSPEDKAAKVATPEVATPDVNATETESQAVQTPAGPGLVRRGAGVVAGAGASVAGAATAIAGGLVGGVAAGGSALSRSTRDAVSGLNDRRRQRSERAAVRREAKWQQREADRLAEQARYDQAVQYAEPYEANGYEANGYEANGYDLNDGRYADDDSEVREDGFESSQWDDDGLVDRNGDGYAYDDGDGYDDGQFAESTGFEGDDPDGYDGVEDRYVNGSEQPPR